MAIKNFIPTIWSEKLYEELEGQYIGIKNCSREYEGEIKGCGSEVKICGVGEIEIREYNRNSEISTPQALSDTERTLKIDQAKCFNFMIDDIDRAQSVPGIMDSAMRVAARALANEADLYLYEACSHSDQYVTNYESNVDNILDTFLEARKILYKNNVTDSSEVVFEISPEIAELVIKAKINLATDNSEPLENGCIGKIAGCKVYVTNNLNFSNEDGYLNHYCIARTQRAVAFAEQISEIEAYRPEKKFADAVKGLHLYGAKIIYPKELVMMVINAARFE